MDSAGSAYVTGRTSSTEASFPVLVGPDLTHNGGTFDAFIAKLNPTGTALVYAGYIGGSGGEWGNGIAVDSAGNAYVTGGTTSSEASFPVTGGPDLTYNGGSYDAFVAKVNPAGTALVYAGYIGGSEGELGNGIAVDNAGNAYVTGSTGSTATTFPATVGPDLTHNGGADAFVAKVNPAGTALVFAGYIGGSGGDFGKSVAVDSAGNAYVAGYTESSQASFPVMGGPNLTHSAYEDAFVAKINSDGTALVYAGYIGGSGFDYGMGIAVDSAGNAYVAGYTNSTEATFPVLGGPDLTFNGFYDAFVAEVNPTGSLVYAGYIGGSGYESGYGIAVDSAGNVYVTGETQSSETSFPVLGGPDLTFNGGSDAFIAKISAATVDVAANANSGAEVTITNPVTLTYQIAGCQNREMYLVLNAPTMGINWSYLNSVGIWIPLPANLADITPFSTAGPADGGYTLYSGILPVGNYDLYFGCDFVTNGHLDHTGGTSINGMYDYILVHVG